MRMQVLVSVVGLFCLSAVALGADLYDEMVLPIVQLEFSQPNWWGLLEANAQTDENIVATMVVDGVAYEGVGVRFRGMTSYMRAGNSKKKSFNIEIDHTLEDQRLMGYKTLNLINSFDDPTFMREPLYSNICRRQVPSAKANFVRLEINGENWGVYGNIQQLNAEFIEDWFATNDGTRWHASGGGGPMPGGGGGQPPGGPVRRTPGDIRIAEPRGGGGGFGDGRAALTWLGDDPAAYEAEYELKRTEQDDPWASLIHACDVLNNLPLSDLPGRLEEVLNVDRALWLCAFEIVFHDDDGYIFKRGADYGLYYEPETGQIHFLQYDGNTCMRWGNAGGWSLFYRADDPQVPVMHRLMAIGPYRQRYLAHVRTILDSFLTEELIFPKIDAYRALIEDEVKADTKKLYSNRAFDSGIEALKTFVGRRRASLLGNRELSVPVPEITAVGQEVVQSGCGQSLTITAEIGESVAVSSVHLYLATGRFERFAPLPMTDDGLHGDGEASDGVFGYMVPEYPMGTLLRYYVQATADDRTSTLAFNPPGAENDVYTHLVTYPEADASPVVINEIMALNDSTVADPQGDYDDWVELVNITAETVDLSGMYLSDNPENPLKWRLPDGTVIGPGGFLLIWADEDGADTPGLHANFRLSASGEAVWLYDTDERGNVLLDSVSYDRLLADQSFGRHPDGTGPWQVLSAPSPLGPNTEPATGQAEAQ